MGKIAGQKGEDMNALVGSCWPAEIGINECHLNLSKTFCISQGVGGPVDESDRLGYPSSGFSVLLSRRR